MISIIIPAFNEEHYLPSLLDSIKRQTYTDYEIIVADGNSTDRTRQIAKKYGCRVVDGGVPGVARNNGAKAAKGKLLLFLDADVILLKRSFLEDLLGEIQAKDLDVGTCKAVPAGGNFFDLFMHHLVTPYMFLMQRIKPHMWGPCMFIRKGLFSRIHGFKATLKLGEDLDLGRRASKHGRFGMAQVYFGASVRRFKKDGYLSTSWKYIKVTVHNLIFNKVKDDPTYAYYSEQSRK